MKDRILNTCSGQKNTTKGSSDTGQWKDRELKHTKLSILECNKYFTTLFLKSVKSARTYGYTEKLLNSISEYLYLFNIPAGV